MTSPDTERDHDTHCPDDCTGCVVPEPASLWVGPEYKPKGDPLEGVVLAEPTATHSPTPTIEVPPTVGVPTATSATMWDGARGVYVSIRDGRTVSADVPVTEPTKCQWCERPFIRLGARVCNSPSHPKYIDGAWTAFCSPTPEPTDDAVQRAEAERVCIANGSHIVTTVSVCVRCAVILTYGMAQRQAALEKCEDAVRLCGVHPPKDVDEDSYRHGVIDAMATLHALRTPEQSEGGE